MLAEWCQTLFAFDSSIELFSPLARSNYYSAWNFSETFHFPRCWLNTRTERPIGKELLETTSSIPKKNANSRRVESNILEVATGQTFLFNVFLFSSFVRKSNEEVETKSKPKTYQTSPEKAILRRSCSSHMHKWNKFFYESFNRKLIFVFMRSMIKRCFPFQLRSFSLVYDQGEGWTRASRKTSNFSLPKHKF